ncbi:ficolin-2-like [Pomacea canaliculata]|uniref:ficolin-2-like n=1 Tax=Pomacea canaliculata TaxID=400727 RepID=UPI000D72662C|nr:ficolin-2-like [Pomacea canaliculata]
MKILKKLYSRKGQTVLEYGNDSMGHAAKSKFEKGDLVRCGVIWTLRAGGWTVFHRRRDFTVDFNRSWTEYENGFGDVSGDFWLGLDAIHKLISYGMRLRVDMVDWTGTHRWAEYSYFRVYGPEGDYLLSVSGYSGDAGDGLAASNEYPFQTYDRNTYGCVTSYTGAWWYGSDCASRADLFSPHKRFTNWGNTYHLMFSEMKTKPT